VLLVSSFSLIYIPMYFVLLQLLYVVCKITLCAPLTVQFMTFIKNAYYVQGNRHDNGGTDSPIDESQGTNSCNTEHGGPSVLTFDNSLPVKKFLLLVSALERLTGLMFTYQDIFPLKNILKKQYFFQGESLDDYPDSPGEGRHLSREEASSILDREDSMETGTPQGMTSTPRNDDLGYGTEKLPAGPSGSTHRRDYSSRSTRDSFYTTSSDSQSQQAPTLPQIYHSVHKKKLSTLVVRHLDGSAYIETESTTSGASLSQMIQVGSFANSGDGRHNLTVHRHDHSTMRNISTSFCPNTLLCKTCQGEHTVLRRSIEGSDVGMDNPPVFVLSDQNFPPMVPVGGEGECLKIVQVENSSLADLAGVFLSVTRGFDLPAGTVILVSSASFAASVGTADYAAEFVRVAAMLRNTFGGGVSVMHGIPFLLGGTKNSPAIRALAEIGQWIHLTSVGTEDISATRKAFAASLRSDISSAPLQYIIRLPHSQLSGEKVPFVVTGFDNLKTAPE
jgi:hypothetical protein